MTDSHEDELGFAPPTLDGEFKNCTAQCSYQRGHVPACPKAAGNAVHPVDAGAEQRAHMLDDERIPCHRG